MLALLGLGVMGASLVFFAWNSDYGYVYRMNLQSRKQLSLNYQEHRVMPSAVVVKAFSVELFCRSEKSALGDYFCASATCGKFGEKCLMHAQ